MELTYFHIINPQTGAPLIASQDSIGSVSVLAPTCALADGLATAAMLFPSVQEAERWIEQIKLKLNGLKFWIEKNN
jgi:thiamine biosynthesis lipoprotein